MTKRRNHASQKLGRRIHGGRRYACEALENRTLLSLFVPAFHSDPGAPVTLYLNFTGSPAFAWPTTTSATFAHGPGSNSAPIPAFDTDGDSTNFTPTEVAIIQAIMAVAAEKFSPFTIDVTNVDPGNRTHGVTLMDIIGGSNSDWSGTGGGVSWPGSFTDPTLVTTVFAWPVGLDWRPPSWTSNEIFLGTAVAHEAGHAFSLAHQRSGTNPTIEYYNGNSIESPIMGNGGNVSSSNTNIRATWWLTNQDAGQQSPDPIQSDLSIITNSANGIGYRPDDYSYSNYLTMQPDGQGNISNYGGTIELAGDDDPFRFQAVGTSAAFSIAQTLGGMLDPSAVIKTTSGHTMATSVDTNTACTVSVTGLTPGQYYFLEVDGRGDYGDVGQYKISGAVSNFAYLNAGNLTVAGFSDFDNNITIKQSGGILTLTDTTFSGTAIQTYTASLVNTIYAFLGAGNDILDFGGGNLAGVPDAALIDMGGGNDSLIVDDAAYNTNTDYDVSAAQINRSSNFFYGVTEFNSSVETVKLITGSASNDTVHVYSTAIPTTIQGGANSIVSIGNNGSAQQINAALTITNPPAYTSVNIDDSADTIARNALLNTTGLIGLTPSAISWTPADISGITISGGSGGNTFGITGAPTPQPGNSNTINGGTGNDIFNMEFASGAFVLNGQAGNDTLTVDDADFSVAENYTVTSSTLSRSGLSFTFNTFETVNVDAGDNADIVTIAGSSPAGVLNVNCNGGNDSVNFGNGTQVINFGDVNLNGGAGFNLLTMDDHLSNAGYEEDYSVSPGFVTESSIFGSEGRFNYNAFAAFTISAGSEANSFSVTGTPAGTSVALQGNNGNDAFNVTPIDIAGLPSILGALSLSGGSGSDAASFLGANNPTGIGYTVSGTAVLVTGGALMGYDSMETLAVNTGATTETSAVTSTSIPTTISSSAASVLDVTPASQSVDNLAAALTFAGAIASTLNIHDELDPDSLFDSQAFGGTLYNRFAEQQVGAQVVIHSTSITNSGLGNVVLDTGTVANSLGIDNNTYPLTINAGTGTTSIAIGSGHTLTGITAAPITITGSGSNAISLDDSAASSKVTVHLNATQVGAAPGDNLFGAGGRLTYAAIASLTLNTTSATAGDTIYAHPSLTTAMTINAGTPATSPGDTLTIAAAGINNPLLTPNGTGAGKYTFGSGYQSVTFTGIELSTVDVVAPAVTAAGATLHYNTLPLSLSFSFTKTLIGAPLLSAFSASSQSAVPVPFSGLSFVGNVATLSITGILPSGNYHGTIHANGVIDVPGNSMSSDYAFNFVILTGDANHDGVLNGDDYFAIDTGYANHATGYVNGDFNYDGRIDADDYFLIDSNYAKGFIPQPAPPAIQRSAAVVATPDTIHRPTVFSNAAILSAYDRLQETDDLL